MVEAGAGHLCPVPRAPRNPATRSRAGNTTAVVSPSPAPRARRMRPAERALWENKSARLTKKLESQGLTTLRLLAALPWLAVSWCSGTRRQLLTDSARGAGASAGGSEAPRRSRRQSRTVHVATPGPLPRATPGPPAGGGGKLQK